MKVSAVIQARITSTRLPNKVLMDIEGKPMLWRVVDRLRFSEKINEIILAIPDTPENDILEKFAEENNVKCFRGSENDVLSRYYEAAKKFNCDVIIRITSDCPLIDPKIVDLVIEKHLNSGADYTANILKRTFPKGLDVEVFNFSALKKFHREATGSSEREHVTLYIRQHPELFQRANLENKENLSEMRWTVDEKEDLEFVREIFKKLYKPGKMFLMKDILELLKKEPKLIEINKNIKRKVIHENWK